MTKNALNVEKAITLPEIARGKWVKREIAVVKEM